MDPATANKVLQTMTEDTAIPALMKPLVAARHRFCQFAQDADQLMAICKAIHFDEEDLVIANLPRRTDGQEMTFFEVFTSLEAAHCRGESVEKECALLIVPARWTPYVNLEMWRHSLQERLTALHARKVAVQELHQRVAETLERRHMQGEGIPKGKLLHLVAALRQTSQDKSNGGGSAYSSPLKGRSPMKDEFGFLLKSFDDLQQRKEVVAGLRLAFSKQEAATKMTLSVAADNNESIVESSSSTPSQQLPQDAKSRPPNDNSSAAWSRRLENFVDRAEELELTHLDEVERAQYLLEDVKRETFCTLNAQSDALKSVDTLASNLVALGAKHHDAVLKAAEIYAGHSNMMMLTNTLRSVFDDMRRAELAKMNERRRRHAQKDREKRERIVEKFRLKQQLLADKIEMEKDLENERQATARAARKAEIIAALVRDRTEAHKRFVWRITKLNVMIVLLAMALVFFERIVVQLDWLRPTCGNSSPPPTTAMARVTQALGSWWLPNSLVVLQCRVAYGAKIVALFVVGGVGFTVIAKLNLLTTALPVVAAVALYHMRDEWRNMLFRSPCVLVLYGFNSFVLRQLTRGDEALLQKRQEDDRATSLSTRRWLTTFVVFPLVSVVLSIVIGITIACDDPHQCVVRAADITHDSLHTLWVALREAYHLA
ncbi:hypothetical protein PINS_up002622 [Pythium insidiosum]|nr:hypothetical protein PINS_up002622 [Pythium insidiosum]